MNSKQLYGAIVEVAGEGMVELGFLRCGGGLPMWRASVSAGELFVCARIDKFGWDCFRGGSFSLYGTVAPSGTKRLAWPWYEILRVFDYQGADTKARILALNHAVCQKISHLDVDSFEAFSSLMDEQELREHHQSMIMHITWEANSDTPWVTTNKPLFFYDRADAAAWASEIPAILAAVKGGVAEGKVLT